MHGRNRMRAWILRAGLVARLVSLALLALANGLCIWACKAQPLLVREQPSVETVRIGVFSLFRPKELLLRPSNGSALDVAIDGRAQELPSSMRSIHVRASDGMVAVSLAPGSRILRGTSLRAQRAGEGVGVAARFWLEVPGKLRREYWGELKICAHGETLEAVVTMPLEIAVASVVQAESLAGAGVEALKAQAVAARSFFAAGSAGHSSFDFCDTTHCQFLRSPPAPRGAAAEAARATHGLILTWHEEDSAEERPLAAMYARSCGGRTRSLREIGRATASYPYYAVRCVYCSHHPEIWRREFSAQMEAEARTEQGRLRYNRIHGWGAIPSNGAELAEGSQDDQRRWISGRGAGHGIGMCQLGAADMARRGASFAQILAHYYPNTRLSAMAAQ